MRPVGVEIGSFLLCVGVMIFSEAVTLKPLQKEKGKKRERKRG